MNIADLARAVVVALSVLSQAGPVYAQASVLSKAIRTSESMEPALAFPAQDEAAQRKLADLRAKTGKRPNIVWLVIDDMGYGDPGAFGGGATVGAATPNMDRLAREGLKLTSTYSQPTCTPTRSAHPDRPPAGAHRPDAPDPCRRQDQQESVGRRDLAAQAARRRRLPHRAVGQVARRRGRGHAPAGHRLRRVLRLLRRREGTHPGRRQAPLSRPGAQSRAA